MEFLFEIESKSDHYIYPWNVYFMSHEPANQPVIRFVQTHAKISMIEISNAIIWDCKW